MDQISEAVRAKRASAIRNPPLPVPRLHSEHVRYQVLGGVGEAEAGAARVVSVQGVFVTLPEEIVPVELETKKRTKNTDGRDETQRGERERAATGEKRAKR